MIQAYMDDLCVVPSVFIVIIGGNLAFARHDMKRLRESRKACACHCELVETGHVWLAPYLTSQETVTHDSHFTLDAVICGTPERLNEIRAAVREEQRRVYGE